MAVIILMIASPHYKRNETFDHIYERLELTLLSCSLSIETETK